MRNKLFSPASAAVLGLSLAAALASGGAWAQTSLSSQPSQQVQARVISATQVTDAQGRLGYDVAYEYEGRRYTTHTDSHPGATIPIEVNAYGVAALPTSPQPGEYATQPPGGSPWDRVVPEQGMVVSGGGAPPAPVYYTPPVVYSAPVYAPAPVYVAPAYGYGYGYGYAPYDPPVGLSLNLGYSRGWGGGRGRWR